FSCTLPTPTTPPLFPYTTLFRSLRAALPVGGGADPQGQGVRGRSLGRPDPRVPRHPDRGGSRVAAPEPLGGREPRSPPPHARGRDRKSTRLNSSHGSISYAVFCL